MRCFIAVEIDPPIRRRLASLQRDLASAGLPVRWVRPERMHLTLRFLGEVADDRLGEIGGVMADVARKGSPFELRVAGAGCFPKSGRRVRVVWVGLEDPTGRLQACQALLEAGLQGLGFEPEDRPFAPHLTLGRVKTPSRPEPLREMVAAAADFDAGVLTVGRMILFESRLQKSGPEYTVRVRERFG
jgi:2'-5' RNA ligase